MCKAFAYDAEERHSEIVFAIDAVTLVLVERNDLCVPHVMGYRTLFPALEQELMHVANERVLSSCLHNLWRKCVVAWNFSTGKRVDGLPHFIDGGRLIHGVVFNSFVSDDVLCRVQLLEVPSPSLHLLDVVLWRKK